MPSRRSTRKPASRSRRDAIGLLKADHLQVESRFSTFEMIKHHVKEEEQPGGMFAKARKSDMDLAELGQRLAARKKQLMNSSGSSSSRRSRAERGAGRAEGRV